MQGQSAHASSSLITEPCIAGAQGAGWTSPRLRWYSPGMHGFTAWLNKSSPASWYLSRRFWARVMSTGAIAEEEPDEHPSLLVAKRAGCMLQTSSTSSFDIEQSLQQSALVTAPRLPGIAFPRGVGVAAVLCATSAPAVVRIVVAIAVCHGVQASDSFYTI